MIDKNGDGEVDIREFLDVALSEEMDNRLRQHDWRKSVISSEEKRRIVEASGISQASHVRTGKFILTTRSTKRGCGSHDDTRLTARRSTNPRESLSCCVNGFRCPKWFHFSQHGHRR